MATLEELAHGYASRLKSATDGHSEARKIADAIDGLRYTGSGRPISVDDKARIVELIREEAPDPKTVVEGGRTRIIKEADNKNYLALVALISGILNG